MSETVSTPTLLRLSAMWPEVELVYEDADLLAVNKPAGLLVAPDRWDKRNEILMGLLADGIAKARPWAVARGLTYLANAHRLDRFTSGVLLLARNRPALVALARQFHDRHPQKRYIALVEGRLPEPPLTVDLPIGAHPAAPGRSVIDRQHGRPVRTVFTELECFRRYSLIQAEPGSGRLHQIRVHLKSVGCPLIADSDYGSGQPLLLSRLKPDYKMKPEGERPLMSRPALHAEQLIVTQPTTGKLVTITAPWPKDLTVAVKYLRKFGTGAGPVV